MEILFDNLKDSIELTFLGYESLFSSWDNWTNNNFGFDEEAAKIKTLGKDGALISANIGLYLFIFMIVIALTSVLFVLKLLHARVKCFKPKFAKSVRALKRRVVYNAYLRTIITGSLSFDHFICVVILLMANADEEHKSKSMIAVFSLCLILMIAVPPLIGFLLLKNRSRLQDKPVK